MEVGSIANTGRNSENSNSLNNGRFSNRAARFYWAEEEASSAQRAYSMQHVMKSDSHFEESPLVIAAISAGVIGVAIIIIILVGIWIRSRLFSEGGRRSSENPNNMSVRSSTSTLDEDAYVVCMEMDSGAVLGSMPNDTSNYCENSTTVEMEKNVVTSIEGFIPTPIVPEELEIQPASLKSDSKEDRIETEDMKSNTESIEAH